MSPGTLRRALLAAVALSLAAAAPAAGQKGLFRDGPPEVRLPPGFPAPEPVEVPRPPSPGPGRVLRSVRPADGAIAIVAVASVADTDEAARRRALASFIAGMVRGGG